MGRTATIVIVLALGTGLSAACGGDDGGTPGDGGPGDGATTDGGPGCTPATSCEASGFLCGLHAEDACGHVDCGPCRWGNADVGYLPSITRDATGGLHLVHLVEPSTQWEVTYAPLGTDGTLGTAEAIAPVLRNTLERAPAIAVATDGTVHVVWATDETPAGSEVWWASRTAPGTWTVESVGLGHFPDLAVDATGHPHVAYEVGGDPGPLRVSTRDDLGAWSFVDVDTEESRWPSMITVAAGVQLAYIGYRSPQGWTLQLAAWNGATWTGAAITTTAQLSPYTMLDLAFDAAGDPWFAFATEGPAFLVEPTSAGFATSTLEPGSSQGVVALALGAADQVHVLYWNDDGMFYRTRTADGAQQQRLVQDACDNGQASIALAPDGTPRLAFDCTGDSAIGRPIDVYPPSYFASCDAAVAALCPEACACNPTSECSYHGASLSTTFGPDSICPGWALEDLCSSDTVDPALIGPCEAALVSGDGVCEGSSLPLPVECDAVIAGNQ